MDSIVTVHDLFGEPTEPPPAHVAKESSFLWLRNLFAYEQNACRILVFKYNVNSFITPGCASDDRLFNEATTLVCELVAERRGDAHKRPLVFLCHGVGGLLVKRALILSSSPKTQEQKDFRNVYISTHAVIFAGTPHLGIRSEALSLLKNGNAVHPSQFIVDLLDGSEFLVDLHDRFVPLAKQIRTCNIWEQRETQQGDYKSHIVDKASAAPDLFLGERWGMSVDHKDLLEFRDPNDSRFKVLMDSLTRHVKTCHQEVTLRWKTEQITQQLATRDYSHRVEGHTFHGNNIQGGRVHFGNVYFYNSNRDESANPLQHQSTIDNVKEATALPLNELYMVPRSPSPQFTGRQLQAEMLKEELGAVRSPKEVTKLKIAVIQGLGGSGKTQFCLKFAEVNRLR